MPKAVETLGKTNHEDAAAYCANQASSWQIANVSQGKEKGQGLFSPNQVLVVFASMKTPLFLGVGQ